MRKTTIKDGCEVVVYK